MLENVTIKGTHVSRIIMSWVRAGNPLSSMGEGYDAFREWLNVLRLSEEEQDKVLAIAFNGKLELEVFAETFYNNYKEMEDLEFQE